MGTSRYNLEFTRGRGTAKVRITTRDAPPHAERLIVAPAFPVDTRIRGVTVNGAPRTPELRRIGDEQRAQITIERAPATTEVLFTVDEGTDVESEPVMPTPGASNQGLRLLRAWADDRVLHVVAEGVGGRSYVVRVRSPRRAGQTDGVTVLPAAGDIQRLEIAFKGGDGYVRREIDVPLAARAR